MCDEIARREDELVELAAHADPLRHDDARAGRTSRATRRRCRRYLAARLERAGADVRRVGARRRAAAGHPMVPEGFSFEGRPQLVARFAGTRRRPDAAPQRAHRRRRRSSRATRWTHDPFAAVVADGRVHGRGACDMKGGVACMVVAAETLADARRPARGDLIVNTVTEEESTGAGGLVSRAHARRPTRAIVPEPSGLDVWIACRGSLLPRITVEGRAGHAGIAPRHPDDGGAVNAIEKMAIVLEAVRAPARAVGAAPAPPVPLARRLRADDHRRRRVARQLPGVVPARLPHRVPARPARTSTATAAASSASSRTGSPRRGRPIRGCASIRPRSSGASAACRRPRSPADDPIVQAALDAARAIGRPSDARRARQLARRRDADVEAGIPADLPRPRRHPPRPHGRGVRADRRSRRLRAALAVTAMRFCGT